MVRSLLLVMLVIPANRAQGAAPSFDIEQRRMQLPCGMQVLIVHAPQAKKQTTFSFLPLHMGNDPADRAQWSHLIEHMLIRSTDPEHLERDGIQFNGETTDSYLRLETFATIEEWEESLDLHARWLTARTFAPQSLEREKSMIEGEERGTAMGGFTGKFALAAWNQAFTHGRAHARVHGDVQSAAIEQVEAYARQRITLDERTLIATIGPTPLADVEAEIYRLLQHIAKPEHAPAAHENDEAKAPVDPAPVSLHATWDLPTHHVFWWWELPDDGPHARAAGSALSHVLLFRMNARRDIAPMLRILLPHATVRNERGTYMLLNACVRADADVDAITKALADECRAVLEQDDAQPMRFAAAMTAQQLNIEPRFDALAQQVPAHMQDMVEGVWLLSLLNHEYPWRMRGAEIREALANLDADAIAIARRMLAQQPSVLVLAPVNERGN